jgi:hypothetical protein
MSDPELCYLTATQATGRFTDNSLSPVELKQVLSAGGATTAPRQRLFGTMLALPTGICATAIPARYSHFSGD